MSDFRNLDDLSQAEQIEVLDRMNAFLRRMVLELVHDGKIKPERIPDDIKKEIATTTEQPSAVNWNSAPELNAADVLAQAEAILL